MRRPGRLAPLLLCIPLLAGCWSSTEINELAFVMGMAVDAGRAAGDYRVTVQVAKPKQLRVSGSGQHAYANFTAEGAGIPLPIHMLSAQVNRRLYTGHSQVMVVGREVAAQGIAPILDFFIRSSDGRLTASLFVAQGAALDVLESDGELDEIPAVFLKSLVTIQENNLNIAATTMIDFLNDMMSKTTAPTAGLVQLLEDGDGQTAALCGVGVFKGDRLCTTLDPRQTGAMLLVRGRGQMGYQEVDITGGSLSLEVISSRTQVTPVWEDGAFRIRVEIDQGCAIVYTEADVDLLSEDVRREIADTASRDTVALLEETLAYCQGYSADVFGFGEQLCRHFPRRSADLIEQWETAFPRLEVDFEVRLEVLSTGAVLHPLEPRSIHAD